MSSAKGSHACRKDVKIDPVQVRVRTTIENEKDNIKVCVCSLLSHNGFFLFSYLKNVELFSHSPGKDGGK